MGGHGAAKRRLTRAALACLIPALAGCDGAGSASARQSASAAARTHAFAAVAAPLPKLLTQRVEAPAVSFAAEGGETITLKRFEGRVVVLSLWARWCLPCMREMPSLDRLAAQMPAVAVVPVSVDATRGLEGATQFLRQRALTHLAAYHDSDGNMMRLLGAHGLPMSFVIDREGRIAATVEGAVDWTSEPMLALLLGV